MAAGLALLAAGGVAAAAWPGVSVQGRPIVAVARGGPDAPTVILVVGIIHGNEPAGTRVTQRLRQLPVPRGVRLWLVDRLNPDGVVLRTRQNAHGVDLNRNFPYRWQRQATGPGQYPGRRPLSEPESRAAARLILRVRPSVTVWFHQHVGPALVDLSGGNAAVERRYARLVGFPVGRLRRYPGSAAGWENHRFPGMTAFVVELPWGLPPPPAEVTRLARAILELAPAPRPH
jgi:protein MpaA